MIPIATDGDSTGDLKDEVYMEALPEFSEDFQRYEVCKLKNTLYGLK